MFRFFCLVAMLLWLGFGVSNATADDRPGPTWEPKNPDDRPPLKYGYAQMEVKRLTTTEGLWFDNHDDRENIIWCTNRAAECVKLTAPYGDVLYFASHFHSNPFSLLENNEIALASWTYWQIVTNSTVFSIDGPAELGRQKASFEHTKGMSKSSMSSFTKSIGASGGAAAKGLNVQVNATMSWTTSKEITITESTSETKTFQSPKVASGQIRVVSLWKPMRAFAFVDATYQNRATAETLDVKLANWTGWLSVCSFIDYYKYRQNFPCTSQGAYAKHASYLAGPFPMDSEVSEYRVVSKCFDIEAWQEQGIVKVVTCK